MSENSNSVRYSDKDLAEFRSVIEQKLEKSKSELEYLRSQIIELQENSGDQQGGDWSDESSLHNEVEMLNDQATRQRQFIQSLENALIRIHNKTYGICSVTGTLIDKKRLLLVPHTTKSVMGKEMENAPVTSKLKKEPLVKKVATNPEKKIITKVIKRSGNTATNKAKDPLDWDDDDDEIDNTDLDPAELDDLSGVDPDLDDED